MGNDDIWHATACILCESNCGIEIRLGGDDGRRFERIRGDKAHPGSQGYTCEKALRLDHYQNGGNRLTAPLRRRADGTYQEVDWDTAIAEVAQRLAAVRDSYGGETILYYGGGGQGNHLGGAYSGATLRALGATYRSNALAQEKTGEIYVNGKMLGSGVVRGDVEHAEVALFVGKNPWQSHGMPHARTVLKEIANDPDRSIIVIDPRRSETAEIAEFHLQVRPGTDAFCLAALVGVIVQEGLVDTSWVRANTTGYDEVTTLFSTIPVAEYAQRSGVDEELVRAAARRIARATSVAVAEDLGIQMNRHSTMNSWLEKLVWLLTGNFGKPGAQYAPTGLAPLARSDKGGSGGGRVTPVTGSKIIGGLVPCNVIPDEILTDHPQRFRALIVESGNPIHSLADTQRMREALDALEFVVVIDVAMTETARHADYVLPAPKQFEKWEATFFNFEFPKNVFHLRHPVLEPPAGVLIEPEIHARLVEALGVLTPEQLAPLRAAASEGREAFATAFFAATSADPALGAIAPIVLYRALGPTLADGLPADTINRDGVAAAALLWGAAHRLALSNEPLVRRAGFTGDGLALGESLFEAVLHSDHGVVFAVDEWEGLVNRLRTADGKVQLIVPELVAELATLADDQPLTTDDFPFVLSAGERRSFTANTIIRDPAWRKRDAEGALRVSPADADRLGLETGGQARVLTQRGSAVVSVEVFDGMQPGHVSLPNGLGLDEHSDGQGLVRTGAAANELTGSDARDPIAGTPWHKHVPANIERFDSVPA